MLALRFLALGRHGDVAYAFRRHSADQWLEQRPRPLLSIDFCNVARELLQIVFPGTHPRDMQPDHAHHIGRREPNRHGKIIGRRLGFAGIKLRASPATQGDGRRGIKSNCRRGIGNRLFHGALDEMCPAAQGVNMAVVGGNLERRVVVGDRRIDVALGKIGIAALAVRRGKLGLGAPGRGNHLTEKPDGLIPSALLYRVPPCCEIGRIGAGREIDADSDDHREVQPDQSSQHDHPHSPSRKPILTRTPGIENTPDSNPAAMRLFWDLANYPANFISLYPRLAPKPGTRPQSPVVPYPQPY